jgi:hypothetical protein
MKTAQQASQKWQTNSAGASTAYEQGIQGVTTDVMGKAIAAAPAAVANYSQAITSGRWAAAINASGGTANWKAMSVAKSGNYGTGIAAGASKYQAAAAKLIPFIEQTVSSLPARQPGNVAANVQNRVLGLATALHQAKGQFKG